MRSAAGRLVYETTPLLLNDKLGLSAHEPNVPFCAAGEFEGVDGRRLRLSGKGFMEYLGGTLDPSRIGRSPPV